jgi:hypothetical protein
MHWLRNINSSSSKANRSWLCCKRTKKISIRRCSKSKDTSSRSFLKSLNYSPRSTITSTNSRMLLQRLSTWKIILSISNRKYRTLSIKTSSSKTKFKKLSSPITWKYIPRNLKSRNWPIRNSKGIRMK